MNQKKESNVQDLSFDFWFSINYEEIPKESVAFIMDKAQEVIKQAIGIENAFEILAIRILLKQWDMGVNVDCRIKEAKNVPTGKWHNCTSELWKDVFLENRTRKAKECGNLFEQPGIRFFRFSIGAGYMEPQPGIRPIGMKDIFDMSQFIQYDGSYYLKEKP